MGENLSKIFVSTLAEAGVERIYGIVGDSLNPVSNAVRADGRIKFVHVRHEETAAFAASAEAQLTGKICACAGTAGPGNTHLMNGLYDATRSGAPVIALASDIPQSQRNTGYFQETHPEATFSDCSKYCGYVGSAAQMPQILQIALQSAVSQGGAATVVLPGDLGDAEIPDASMSIKHPPLVPLAPPVPPRENLVAAAKLIDKSRRITLFCGAGCAAAHGAIVDFARKIAAPVAYTLRGKEIMGADNPFDIGMTGLIGWGGATDAMRDCDLLVMLGTNFPYSAWIPSAPKILQIDIRGENLGRRARVDFGILGDVGQTVRALTQLVAEKTDTAHLKSAIEATERSRRELSAYLNDISCGEKPHPEYAAFLVDKHAADDAVFVVPTGLGTVWCARYITPKHGRRIIGSFTHGSMGNELGMAIGAQLAYPDRQVAAVCGDGSFTMLMGDLLTVAQYDLPVKIFVFNNGTLGFIDLEMMAAGYAPFMTKLKNPDFAKLADVIGIKGIRVDDVCALEPAIKEAFAQKGAVLVDIASDPNAIALPPKISYSQAKNFSLALGKIALSDGIKSALGIAVKAARLF